MHTVIFDSVHKIFRQSSYLFWRKRIETHALCGLSFEVGMGEVLCLLGPNGSGKSTTLRLISTMLLPDRGAVLVNGADTRCDSPSIRRQVGFAVAAERSFYPRLTVRENLDFFATLEMVPRRERSARVEAALRDVGLSASASKQAMKLSSGMYQRLGIARALVKRPRLLLLDEPTRSLDPSASEQFWRLLRNLADTGMSVVIATHNFSESVSVSDRVAVLFRGQLLGIKRRRELSAERLRNWYLQTTGEPAWQPWAEEVPA